MPALHRTLHATLQSSIYSELCWNCILKRRSAKRDVRSTSIRSYTSRPEPINLKRGPNSKGRRPLHNSSTGSQQHTASITESQTPNLPPLSQWPIRDRLAQWQQENGNPMSDFLGLDTPFGVKSVIADNYGNGGQLDPEPDNDAQEDGIETDDLVHEESSDYGGDYMNIGDLVELSSPLSSVRSTICVFVRALNNTQVQLITMRGKYVTTHASSIFFSVPKFMDKKYITPILPYLPTEEVLEALLGQTQVIDTSVSRDLTSPIVKALNDFHDESEKVYRDNAAILDNAHDALAHSTDLRFGTLERITDRLIGKRSGTSRIAAMYAVRTALKMAGMGFGIDKKSHRITGVFQIRSKEQLKYLTTVKDWLREYQEYGVAERLFKESLLSEPPQHTKGSHIVTKFVEKARTLITESRQDRSADFIERGMIGPSSRRFPLSSPRGTLRYSKSRTEFTEDESVIIRLFEYLAVQSVLVSEESLRSLLPLLLRGTGMYEGNPGSFLELGNKAGMVFLQEIGVLAPWENPIHYDVNLLLPSSQHSKPLQQLATTLDQLDKSKVSLQDSMAALRRDLPHVTAYAIDDAGAAEIDDAISIERIPGSDSTVWLHVHIANPTAFIERDSAFARMAAHLTESFYSPDRNVPLLPSWISQDMFGIAPGNPCMTISSKIDLEGNILDFKIESNTLRNVVKLTYAQLPEVLGLPVKQKKQMDFMVVGGSLPLAKPVQAVEFPESQVADLKLLLKYAQARNGYRVRGGGLVLDTFQARVYVHALGGGASGLDTSYPHRTLSQHILGDPIIALQPSPYKNPFNAESRSLHELLVAECMILAGESAGKWCHARGLPVPYRGLMSLPGHNPMEFWARSVQPALDKYGYVPASAGFRYFESMGKGCLKTSPQRHALLGIDNYLKVTSPLRRYGDMITHWQIEAALREEARMDASNLTTTKRVDYLPFSLASMENINTRLLPREKLITSAKAQSQNHWISQWFFRAHYFKEYPLPEVFPVVIQRVLKGRCGVVMLDTGAKVSALSDDPMGTTANGIQLREGDVWEARILDVTPFLRSVHVKLTRLIKEELA